MFTKSTSKKIRTTMLSLVGLLIAIVLIAGTAKGQDIYLDNYQDGDTINICKDSTAGLTLHPKAGLTFDHWNFSISPYDYFLPAQFIANDFNTYVPSGLVTCYYSGSTQSIYLHFNEQLTTPVLTSQTFCSGNPYTLSGGNTGPCQWPHFSWSNGETTPTITTNVTGAYYVNVWNYCGYTTSNTALLTFVNPQPNFCVAGFDLVTQKNKLIWNNVANQQADTMVIWKLNVSNVMVIIAKVPYSDGEYIDMLSIPQTIQAEYALQIIDTCGNPSNVSVHHITPWLSISDHGSDNYFQYIGYIGFYVPTYTLYGIRSNGQVDSLLSTAATFNDFYLPDSIASNYVKFYLSFPVTCSGKSVVEIRSNSVLGLTGIEETDAWISSIYPNPANDRVSISTKTPYQQIIVTDITGRQVKCPILQKTTTEFSLSVGELSSGVYFVGITTLHNNRITGKFCKQ